MDKKKTILSIITLLFAILLIGLSIYKFNYEGDKNNIKDDIDKEISKEHYFTKNEILEIRKNPTTAEKDKDTYKESIVTEIVKSNEYNYFASDKSIGGNVYIGDDKYLYITESNSSETYRISTIKFKTMYAKDYYYNEGIYIILLGEDNKVYCMVLTENDITKANVVPVYTTLTTNVLNFATLDIKSDISGDGTTMFVLTDDGNIYDVASGIRYNPNIVLLYNKVFVFEDNTMTNIWAEQIQDKNKQNYKIKYIFYTLDKSELIENDKLIIITEDDRFIYFDDDVYNVYEFNKKVKDIKFNQNIPYFEGNLEITFEDDYKVKLLAASNEHFALNEFKLDIE